MTKGITKGIVSYIDDQRYMYNQRYSYSYTVVKSIINLINEII